MSVLRHAASILSWHETLDQCKRSLHFMIILILTFMLAFRVDFDTSDRGEGGQDPIARTILNE